MSLDELNTAVASIGGKWVKLRDTADDPIEGVIVAFETRPRTDLDGNVVFKKGTQTPRTEWLFTLEVDDAQREGPDDDGLRKLPANESMQRAISDAIKKSGEKAAEGGRLAVKVKADPADKFSQADYSAKYTPPVKALDINEDDWT
jgi:hypothetical protein